MTAESTGPCTGFLGRGPTYLELLNTHSAAVLAPMRRVEPGYVGTDDIPVERYLIGARTARRPESATRSTSNRRGYWPGCCLLAQAG